MTDTDFISIAKRGYKYWNELVTKDHTVRADFSNIDFTDPEVGITSFEKFDFSRGVDFSGATFGDNFSFAFGIFSFADFSNSSFGAMANFEHVQFGYNSSFFRARFGPSTNFSNSNADGEIFFKHSVFGDSASFERISFKKAYFQSAQFRTHVSFDNALLEHSPIFTRSTFGRSASFRETQFGSHTNFSDCLFGSMSSFFKASFDFGTKFRGSQFCSMTRFVCVTFRGGVDFDNTTFGNQAEFDESKFVGFTSFRNCVLKHPASFQSVSFEHIADFHSTHFFGQANFYRVSFSKLAQFTNCNFGANSYFTGVYGDGVAFSGATFRGIPYIGLSTEDDKVLFRLTGTVFKNSEGTNDVVGRLQTLKSIADATNAINESRDLFVLQRTAELRASKTRFPASLVKQVLWNSYGIFGDFGRSPTRPLVWYALLNTSFYFLYRNLIHEPLFRLQEIAIRDYTLANSMPFGRLLNPAFDTAVQILFRTQMIETDRLGQQVVVNYVAVPSYFQFLGIVQNTASVTLIFLVLLAIRNYFKIG